MFDNCMLQHVCIVHLHEPAFQMPVHVDDLQATFAIRKVVEIALRSQENEMTL